ncbi:uncharacterized protein DDB_G0290587 [Drosophila biarmipes]|uniref:uncharacterized protein DDB_G0290587 n=1 Tax=Drosophila biarmipes TaxID=125945 RepID=UPI0007E868B2|nr:uncharacterized protein DDB_G0290587 [Drosophila biarmipes]
MWLNVVITLILAGSSLTNAFWWPKTTTETREPSGGPMLQQIPLTYFRTYTYQPLAPGFFGFGAPQTPLLPGPPPHQYDPYAVTSYAAARRHDSVARQEVTAPSSTTSTTSTTPAPTTTTTTTTTTTPAPTTTTSTTTSTTPPPPPPPPAVQSTSSSFSEGSTSSLLRFGEYPTYNRRVSNLYNARPQYPYPDYFNYQTPQQQSPQQSVMAEQGVSSSGSRIQFVPCMCPVSMPSLLPSSTAATTSPHPGTSPASFASQPAARHIERQDLEAEADGETGGEGDEEEEDEEEQEVVEQLQEEGTTSSVKPALD